MEASELAKNILVDPDYDEFANRMKEIDENEGELSEEGFKKLFTIFKACIDKEVCGKSFKTENFKFSLSEGETKARSIMHTGYVYNITIGVAEKTFLNQESWKNIFHLEETVNIIFNSKNIQTYFKYRVIKSDVDIDKAFEEFKDYLDTQINKRLEKSRQVLRISEKIKELL